MDCPKSEKCTHTKAFLAELVKALDLSSGLRMKARVRISQNVIFLFNKKKNHAFNYRRWKTDGRIL